MIPYCKGVCVIYVIYVINVIKKKGKKRVRNLINPFTAKNNTIHYITVQYITIQYSTSGHLQVSSVCSKSVLRPERIPYYY